MSPTLAAMLTKEALARRDHDQDPSLAAFGGGVMGGITGGGIAAHMIGKRVGAEVQKAKGELLGKVKNFQRLSLFQKLKFIMKKR